jgi:hypothetical protein
MCLYLVYQTLNIIFCVVETDTQLVTKKAQGNEALKRHFSKLLLFQDGKFFNNFHKFSEFIRSLH